MAKLRIYSDIVTENEKQEMQFWGFAGGVTFNDVSAFCDGIPEDDGEIEVLLHCDGGDVNEGWSIYDRLRATGKTIRCIVEGKASSMATVIMMAAPKEERKAYENADILVHNPYCYTMRPLTADVLATMEADMRREQKKMVDLYVERCGCTAEEIQEQMDKNVAIGTDRALELGLIGEVLPPMSAKEINESFNILFNLKGKEMNEEKVQVEKSVFDKILAKLGFKSVEDVKFGMSLNTADGATIEVEREEGEPQVGDKATPDGEFLMPDGTTIVVENGKIVEIKPKTVGEQSEEDDILEQDDDKAEIERLKSEIDDLKAENERLKQELEDAKKNAKTTDDLRVLNAVKIAGGEKALAKLSSGYVPEGRSKDGKRVEERKEGRVTTEDILARMEKNNKKK